MEEQAFNKFYNDFREAQTDDKINLYCSTPDITGQQYKMLLSSFSKSEMKLLEIALAE